MKIEKLAPIPQGKYIPAVRFGSFIFTAGMTARKNGVPILTGRVTCDRPLSFYRDAVCQAVSNALVAAQKEIKSGESISRVISMSVYINAEDGFTAHSKLADFASNFLYEEFGDVGIAARAAIGVATLPGDAPVEIQLICAVE